MCYAGPALDDLTKGVEDATLVLDNAVKAQVTVIGNITKTSQPFQAAAGISRFSANITTTIRNSKGNVGASLKSMIDVSASAAMFALKAAGPTLAGMGTNLAALTAS